MKDDGRENHDIDPMAELVKISEYDLINYDAVIAANRIARSMGFPISDHGCLTGGIDHSDPHITKIWRLLGNIGKKCS